MGTDFNKIKCFLITRDKTQSEVRKLSKKLTDFDLTFISPSDNDWLTLRTCLRSCPKDKYCFFIKDDSISYAKADIISKYILSALKSNWDIFYLCRWLDNCEKYNNYTKGEGNYLTTRFYSPHGLQSMILSPMGRNKLDAYNLESEEQLINFIQTEKLTAEGSVPNLFNVDPSRYVNDLDVVKTFACQTVYPAKSVDLSEPAIVNNLQTQLYQNILPTNQPTIQEKTFYSKLSSTSPSTVIIWLMILIMFISLIDGCILCYRNYKKKEEN